MTVHAGRIVALLGIAAAAAGARGTGTAAGREIVIAHVAVVDVATGAVRRDMSVRIDSNRIISVKPSNTTPAPAQARVIDSTDKYLIPGLWDAHVHLSYMGSCALPVFVANGVTAVRDAGARLDEVRAWRREIARGELVGPYIRTAGPDLESGTWLDRAYAIAPPDHQFWYWGPRIRVDGPDDARRIIDSLASLGVDFVKFRNLSRPTFLAIAREARRRGLPLVGHAPHGTAIDEAADSGMSSIEHAETITLALDTLSRAGRLRMFQELARVGTRVTPTLVTEYESHIIPDSVARAIVADTAGRRDPERRYVSARMLGVWASTLALNAKGDDGTTDWHELFERQVADMRMAHRAHVRFLAGTDLGSVPGLYPGASLHDELRLLVQDVGLTPHEALRAATTEPAMLAPGTARRGVIAPGAVADLVLLDANPLDDIDNTRRIRAVVSGGRLLDRAALDGLLASVATHVRRREACGPMPDAPAPGGIPGSAMR